MLVWPKAPSDAHDLTVLYERCVKDLHVLYSSFAIRNDVVSGQDLSFEFGVELVVAVWDREEVLEGLWRGQGSYEVYRREAIREREECGLVA